MDEPNIYQPCLNCQGGRKHLQSATLMTWLGDTLISVPNFPAWICDICGHRSYDSQALAQLSMMLNPEAGTPVQPALTPPDKKPRANTPPPS
jgi:YgiT-type zinc finger domain-containing protein